jgi:fructokinase
MDPIYGGIESGGTKFVCATGRRTGELLTQTEIPTTTPEETLNKVIEFFKKNGPVVAIGVGSFGPLDLDPSSNTYGHITKTPKEGWSNFDIRGRLADALQRPVEIETDVGCAGMGEYFFGTAKGINDLLYMTIGTGIGGAHLRNGMVQHGQGYPEMGHLFIPHDKELDPFPGACPFHGDCLEGLAGGLALEKRAGDRKDQVIDPVRWDIEARYIALALSNIILTMSPKIIVIGGGVAKHGGLIAEVKALTEKLINGYVPVPMITEASENNAIKGAIRLAAHS